MAASVKKKFQWTPYSVTCSCSRGQSAEPGAERGTYGVVDVLDHDDADHTERDDGETLFHRLSEWRAAGGCSESLGEHE